MHAVALDSQRNRIAGAICKDMFRLGRRTHADVVGRQHNRFADACHPIWRECGKFSKRAERQATGAIRPRARDSSSSFALLESFR